MNAHTSNYADFVINDSDFIDVLPLDYIVDEPMQIQRQSQDKGRLNNHGTMLLDMCKQTGLRIMNGRCGEDKSGQYTHVGSRGSSVVDYVVSSQHLFKHVSNFRIESPNILSDHCCINFSFEFNDQNSTGNLNACSSNEGVNCKYVWKNDDSKTMFIDSLSSDDILNKLQSFTFKVDNAACANDIDCCITSFSGIIEEVASPFKHNIRVSNSENSHDLQSCNNNPWFNEECFEKRRLFYSCLNW